ncbi:hypothetical protein VMY22_5 [Bacillus phage VMY22]|uniref:Uncharacterized protein n=1 Tax=Bacillus phage VMY22 TaxID=1734382 RepID=A0A0N9RRF5_9CAUD|nr:hypothetical protein VMY22_5 [Bacillus phage VMY22]ALH46470.1 hypothetical protein VMY22_5 [Bacillus phage VMY22]
MVQLKQYDFKGKIAGSVVENKAIAYLNDVEFTQEQYDGVYNSSMIVPAESTIRMEFPIEENKGVIQTVSNYFTGKIESGTITLAVGDYAVYNRSGEFKQSMLDVNISEMTDNKIVMTFTATKEYEFYRTLLTVLYDDEAINRYTGVVSYLQDGNMITETLNSLVFTDLISKLQSYPENSIDNSTFSKVPYEGVE